MALKTNMTHENKLKNHLDLAKTFLYDKCNFELTELIVSEESQEYGACSFKLNGLKIQFRISKITPNKVGQFVTIWKRNEEGITAPFDLTDEIDYIIISSQNEDQFGHFIFPKEILLEKGIITGNNKGGKRGIRVYPPWDTVINKQAEKTQLWQLKYFVILDNKDASSLNMAKQLLGNLLEN